MLGARIMEDCERYLGLPIVRGKYKVNFVLKRSMVVWDLET